MPSVISINLLSNSIEITLRHGCSPLNLLHFFRTPFIKNTSGWLLCTYTLLEFTCSEQNMFEITNK